MARDQTFHTLLLSCEQIPESTGERAVVDTASGTVDGNGGPRIITAGENFELPARSLLRREPERA